MRCIEIEKIETDSDLYDLEIDGGNNNYIANGIVVHNTFCQIGMVPSLHHDELFGENKNIYVCSKGLGGQGLVFKNNEQNQHNLYVKALLTLLANGLEEQLTEYIAKTNAPIRIFGEIYGRGVQDLHYNCEKPAFAVFDIMDGDYFSNYIDFCKLTKQWELPVVPMLYFDVFNLAKLEEVRDGKTMLGGKNIREGIVVKTINNTRHEAHGRKIAKMVSPAYLLRKGEATEFN